MLERSAPAQAQTTRSDAAVHVLHRDYETRAVIPRNIAAPTAMPPIRRQVCGAALTPSTTNR